MQLPLLLQRYLALGYAKRLNGQTIALRGETKSALCALDGPRVVKSVSAEIYSATCGRVRNGVISALFAHA